ncbi:MAG TPA: carboxypeptidase-like regulatory domain-containing protein [Verrucomicrobiae bacterium]|nr:carboxypeptidase-like regulatory domain-containing protein [Verrucomicrobiae bacterium]
MTSTVPTPRSTSVETQQRKFIEAFNTSITFFGQVLDQNGAPVVSANVQIAANDKAFGGKPSQYALKSDAGGRFSISGISGITLSVEVSKPGYRIIPPADNRVTSSGVFNYALSSSRGRHQPNPDNPVRFSLYKIGPSESLYKVPTKDYPIAQNGSPLVISLDPAGAHRVVLRCWSNKGQNQQQYDWRVEIEPINGGLAVREGVSVEAPGDGYVSKDSMEMPASLPREHWDSSAERSYFLRFDDGLFGSAKMQIHSAGDRFVTWESLLNANPGSRNLEPGR